jgi:hypothetical protein
MSQYRHTSKIKRTLLPGQPGTKKLGTQYGDRLICVRYRYDPERQRKITTVEVVVDERPWKPDPQRIHPNKRLALTVGYDEVDVRNTVKTAGGVWNPQQKVWKLAYKQVMALGLMDRVVSDGTDKETG